MRIEVREALKKAKAALAFKSNERIEPEWINDEFMRWLERNHLHYEEERVVGFVQGMLAAKEAAK